MAKCPRQQPIHDCIGPSWLSPNEPKSIGSIHYELCWFICEFLQNVIFLFTQEVNEDYKEGIRNLENFVMVRFNNDSMVQPIESQVHMLNLHMSHFSSYACKTEGENGISRLISEKA